MMQNYDKVNTNEYGTTEYTLNGKLHRIDGPAVIFKDDTQYWYQYGKLHNDNGPAVIRKNGTQFWFKNGELHNDNGPAVIWLNGRKEYWIEGNELSKEEFDNRKIASNPKDIMMENYDKVTTDRYGTTEYTLNSKLHRIDGPARIYSNGTQEWLKNGKFHNEYGPARIYKNGHKEYWIEGNELSKEEFDNRKIKSFNEDAFYIDGKKMSSSKDYRTVIEWYEKSRREISKAGGDSFSIIMNMNNELLDKLINNDLMITYNPKGY